MERKVTIGKTGLTVHPIGLGTNKVGSQAGKEVVQAAIENGINFLDTAYLYGPERSEELVGEVVKESGKRTNVVIATKIGPKFVNNQVVADNTPSFLKQEAEKSLKRLKTDYIDILYIHMPDQDTPKEEAVGALQELKEEGKIRAIGVSNFSLEQLKEANQDRYVDVYQGEYNLLNRQAERTLFPYLREHQISFVPYFPLASGLLTGKYDETSTIQGYRANLPYFQGEAYRESLEKVEKLKAMAKSKGVNTANLALAWCLHRKEVDAIIPGARNPEQMLSNLKTLDVTLTEEDIKQLDAIF
ncbi:MAG: aldo/keto reductase [Thermoactinomyces vulgaris]|jgi:myo-inositol catabolism protein IolS|uniref:aldo/keto reductase n=1 Tax=Thermoactinomyces sp. Gus2-1 TaxID=1535750 RepID=UPI000502D3C1|nr:aldo/keto reductase [Thermoactinomyces sp. Gus2-1]KFZ41572.1 oxidoreductase [Thermoactinomyces sp. Gus2-1]